jgi:DNA-binding NarL/FixJ family response regulator
MYKTSTSMPFSTCWTGMAETLAGGGKTILVVDDTLESLRVVAAALEFADYTVLIARDGAAALRSMALVVPDLVIMDGVMPVLDGFETTSRMKADPRLANVPVIFMTGLIETEHVLRGLAAGGVDYVQKPVVLEELLARVEVHLGNARIAQGGQVALDESGRLVFAINSSGSILWATPRTSAVLAGQFGDTGLPALVLAGLRQLTEEADRAFRVGIVGGELEFTLLSQNGPDEWLIRLAEIIQGAEERLLASRHGLTDREAEVLLWISRGKANRQISEILGISPRTVNKHLEQVFEKMGIENRASAAAAAVKTLTSFGG